jgi:hypothetical protein
MQQQRAVSRPARLQSRCPERLSHPSLAPPAARLHVRQQRYARAAHKHADLESYDIDSTALAQSQVNHRECRAAARIRSRRAADSARRAWCRCMPCPGPVSQPGTAWQSEAHRFYCLVPSRSDGPVMGQWQSHRLPPCGPGLGEEGGYQT